MANCPECKNKSSCFKFLKPLELDFANNRRVELTYKKGEHIAKQGSFLTHVLFLQTGLVKIYKEIPGDFNLILTIYSDGHYIGLPHLFSSETFQYSVAALEDSVICAIDRTVFEELILSNPQFGREILSTVNQRTLYHYNKIVTMTRKQLNGSMADALLYLADEVFHANRFKLSLTRKDLGEFAGMSHMSAVRVIKSFTRSGIIAEERGCLEILDKKTLETLSKNG
ncbi:MAG: Crp/Fnr family transcriptional regulator [Bacteroidales bacterium]|nr:Crp/Fnr family transcriptional regulator [Bacteroidales bacterium]